MNAIAYYRYSSHKQGEQSIEGQQNAARRWASENGYSIVKEYADRAISGRSDDRAQFQLMLREIQTLHPAVLILWKIDRMGRNKEEIVFNKYKFKKAGVKVVYTAENIPDSPEGVILESIMEGMAEYYSLQMSQNIRRGMDLSASKYQSLGGMRSLGYVTGPDKRLTIEPKEAELVKEIYRLYLEGYAQSDIVKILNSRGAKTVRGTPFTRSSLRAILKNEKYIGVYKYKDIRQEGIVPPIISKEDFDSVQHKLKINHRTGAKHRSPVEFYLVGKLFCGRCGSGMVGYSGHSRERIYYYYSCSGKHHGGTCKKKNVRKDWIEDIVIRQIELILLDDDLLTEIAHSVYLYYISDSNEDFLQSLYSSRKEIQNAINNLMSAIEAGVVTKTTTARLAERESQLEELNELIATEEANQKRLFTEEQFLYALRRFRESDPSTLDGKRKLIDTFINSIYLYDDKLIITFNYSSDGSTITLEKADIINSSISNGVDSFEHGVIMSTKTAGFETFFIFENVFGLALQADTLF